MQQPCRKECMLLKKRANNAMSISFSHIRNHKMQNVNLQWKRVWWAEGNTFVRLRLSTKAIKTLKTKVFICPVACAVGHACILLEMCFAARSGACQPCGLGPQQVQVRINLRLSVWGVILVADGISEELVRSFNAREGLLRPREGTRE